MKDLKKEERRGQMSRYFLNLYDNDGNYKKREYHDDYILAYRSGQNWLMLTKGNTAIVYDTKDARVIEVGGKPEEVNNYGLNDFWHNDMMLSRRLHKRNKHRGKMVSIDLHAERLREYVAKKEAKPEQEGGEMTERELKIAINGILISGLSNKEKVEAIINKVNFYISESKNDKKCEKCENSQR